MPRPRLSTTVVTYIAPLAANTAIAALTVHRGIAEHVWRLEKLAKVIIIVSNLT